MHYCLVRFYLAVRFSPCIKRNVGGTVIPCGCRVLAGREAQKVSTPYKPARLQTADPDTGAPSQVYRPNHTARYLCRFLQEQPPGHKVNDVSREVGVWPPSSVHADRYPTPSDAAITTPPPPFRLGHEAVGAVRWRLSLRRFVVLQAALAALACCRSRGARRPAGAPVARRSSREGGALGREADGRGGDETGGRMAKTPRRGGDEAAWRQSVSSTEESRALRRERSGS